MHEKLEGILLIYFLIINILAFLLMAIDKRRSISNKWRIPEKTLLTIGFVGGAFGAFLGMRAFRHKTKRKKFTILVPLSMLIYLVIIAYILAN